MTPRSDPHASHEWPAHRYGPNGENEVFQSAAEVPAGWLDHPSKHAEKPAKHTPAAPVTEKAKPAAAPAAVAPAASNGPAAGTGVDPATVDAEGYAFDPEMHAATRSITKGGLWRMKVGVSRPAAKEGFPKQTLDL